VNESDILERVPLFIRQAIEEAKLSGPEARAVAEAFEAGLKAPIKNGICCPKNIEPQKPKVMRMKRYKDSK